MTSINTNSSAINALSILRDTNKMMLETQNRISTGLKVASSKDDASTYSIAQGIRSDMKTFGTIKDALALGQSTMSVATKAVDAIQELTGEIRKKIAGAQSGNVDRNVIQEDINQLVAQIESQVDSADFNGANLLKGDVGGNSTFDVLSGFNSQGVAQQLKVNYQDLTTTATANTTAAKTDGGLRGADGSITFTNALATNDLKEFSMSFTSSTGGFTEVVLTKEELREIDDITELVSAVNTALDAASDGQIVALTASATGNVLKIFDGTNNNVAVNEINVEYAGGKGGIAELKNIDVTDQAGAEAALAAIETIEDTVKAANSSLGSAQKRMDLQAEFMQDLVDSLATGLSSLVDADMTEESVKLSQFQAKTQLGIQAMSIANQNSSSILGLFR